MKVSLIVATTLLSFWTWTAFGTDAPQEASARGLVWVEEWLTCVDAAESLGMSRAEARQMCSLSAGPEPTFDR